MCESDSRLRGGWAAALAAGRVGAMRARDKMPRSQAEHKKHGRVAHLFELRRVDEPGLGSRTRSRCDRHILLAVDLEAHRRSRNARAAIVLPPFRNPGVA